jgi:hypothetical protein
MPNTDRHTEFFGPDFARGPFAGSNLDTASIQIAAAIAQVRAPLARDDSEISAHAQYIRDLADIIAPETATFVNVSSEPDAFSGTIITFRANTNSPVLMRFWLADVYGGGISNESPADVYWQDGNVLQSLDNDRQFIFTTNTSGIASLLIESVSSTYWYLGVARGSRVFYTGQITVE